MHHVLTLGMPHLLSNCDLNLNHLAKIFGDKHWRYMNQTPSNENINKSRIYQSFLRIEFDINDTFKEDNKFIVHTSGKFIDDYIYKTTHQFANNVISMYTIGIIVVDGKIYKANSTGLKDKDFWITHKASKYSNVDLVAPLHFPTYYNIDFNCAKILYCANYLKFIYQYCDVMSITPNIKSIDFFGNIEPKATITVGKSGDGLIMLDGARPIARVN